MLEIAAQVIGVLGVGVSFFIFLGRRRSTILISKFCGEVLWLIHYALIGAYSGAILNIVGMARESVFYNKEKKWASHRFWLYLFLAITVVSCLATWEGPISLLPMIGSCCMVVSFWCTKPLHIRLMALPSQTLWLIYGILHRSVPSTVSTIIALVSIFIGLWKDLQELRQNKQA